MRLTIIYIFLSLFILGCASKEEKVAEETQKLFLDMDVKLRRWREIMPGDDPVVKQRLAEELGEMVWKNRDYVEDAILQKESPHRSVAIGSVGFSRDIRWIPFLMEALTETEELQTCALLSLGVIGNKHVPIEEIQILATSPNSEIRANAVFALGRISASNQDQQIILPLTAYLKDNDSKVRTNAAIAMGELGYKECIPSLTEALNDGDPYVRASCVSALGKIGGKDVASIINPLQNDKDPRVRRAVAQVLSNLSSNNEEEPS